MSDRAQPEALWPTGLEDDPDWRSAVESGVDLGLLSENFRMPPAWRLMQLRAMDDLFVKVHGTAWRR